MNPRINERKSKRVKRCLTLLQWPFVYQGMRENDGTRESVKEMENIFSLVESQIHLCVSLVRERSRNGRSPNSGMREMVNMFYLCL
jgi:hypothetical protein